MREILFRGKRLDNGEWVYGSFLQVEHEDGSFATAIFQKKDAGGDAEVSPATVGQYTGLRDKNGKRIFEGDLLSLRTGRPHVVRFEDGAFVFENTAIPMRFANKLEVIGNVHDNPELLEVSGNAYAAI